ncbi:hypothetical protein ACFL3Z_01845 [Gemmatimonadota bacterium]
MPDQEEDFPHGHHPFFPGFSFLSAGDPSASFSEYLVEQGQEASRASRDQFTALRNTFERFQEAEGDPLHVADSLVTALEALPFIGDALTVSDLTSGPPADSFAVFMRNSYHPDRWTGGYGSQGSGVLFRFVEGFFPSTSPQGSGHGNPYHYDRHVPLIFYGAGVESGISMEAVRTVDIAPTLARLAGIPVPSDLDGQPLLQ